MSARELQALAAQFDERSVEPSERLGVDSCALVVKEVLFHDENRFWQFTPAQVGRNTFARRLLAWLQNSGISADEAATLLRVVPEIQFVDRDDMITLYRAAFDGPIQRWLMDILGLSFALSDNELRAAIFDGVDGTWFCPVTDSFDIAQFHHANGLSSKDHRPPWRVLRKFGDATKIRDYMAAESLRRLVLLEDFVGSGTQVSGPIAYALTLGVEVLFVPLITTVDGLTRLSEVALNEPRLTIAPVFVLPRQVQVREEPSDEDYSLFRDLRSVVNASFDRVREPMPPETEALEEAFGFRGLGTLLVMYTNCPNNTLPLIWHDAPEWSALFPRVSRA